jgi:hypothetical protein
MMHPIALTDVTLTLQNFVIPVTDVATLQNFEILATDDHLTVNTQLNMCPVDTLQNFMILVTNVATLQIDFPQDINHLTANMRLNACPVNTLQNFMIPVNDIAVRLIYCDSVTLVVTN